MKFIFTCLSKSPDSSFVRWNKQRWKKLIFFWKQTMYLHLFLHKQVLRIICAEDRQRIIIEEFQTNKRKEAIIITFSFGEMLNNLIC